jgi:hypothetical protein
MDKERKGQGMKTYTGRSKAVKTKRENKGTFHRSKAVRTKIYTFVLSRGKKSLVAKIARPSFLRACLELYKYDRLRGYGVDKIVDEKGKIFRFPDIKEIKTYTEWSQETQDFIDERDMIECMRGTPEIRYRNRQDAEADRNERLFSQVKKVA